MTLHKYVWLVLAGLLQLTPAHGQAPPWKIEMRQVRLPTANADCGPIEIVVRDAEGKPPVTPDGKQIDWQDFDITLTQGEGPLKLTGNGRFLCASSPGATGVITVKYPESTYLTGTGKGRTGKQLIPGVTVTATLEVSSAGTSPAPPRIAQKEQPVVRQASPTLQAAPPPTFATGTAAPQESPGSVVNATLPPPQTMAPERTPLSVSGTTEPATKTTASMAGPTLAPAPIPVGTTAPATVVTVTPYDNLPTVRTSITPQSSIPTSTSAPPTSGAAAAANQPQSVLPVMADIPVISGGGIPMMQSCAVEVSSIKEIAGFRVQGGGTKAVLTWNPIPCTNVIYAALRTATLNGQVQQVELPAHPLFDLSGQSTSMYAVDDISTSGLFTANYRVDAKLPDGRTISTQSVLWDATAGPASGENNLAFESSLPGTLTSARQTAAASTLSMLPPRIDFTWLAPVDNVAVVFYGGVPDAKQCIVTWTDNSNPRNFKSENILCSVGIDSNGYSWGFHGSILPSTPQHPFSFTLRVTAIYADGTERRSEQIVGSDTPPFASIVLRYKSAGGLQACRRALYAGWYGRMYFRFDLTGLTAETIDNLWNLSGDLFYPERDFFWWPSYRIFGPGLPPEGQLFIAPKKEIISNWDGASCVSLPYVPAQSNRVKLSHGPADSNGNLLVPSNKLWESEWEISEPTYDGQAGVKAVSSSYGVDLNATYP